jgi:hypothetical protein
LDSIEDLLCKHCEGCGFVLSQEWEDWGRSHNEMPPSGHPLYQIRQERTCPECDGEGLANDKDLVLRTDTTQEAVSTLEMFSDALERVRGDLHRWKWAILLLHSAVQGFMALALNGRGVGLLQDDPAGEWLNTLPQGGNYPEEKLDSFMGMYKKIRNERMFSPGNLDNGPDGMDLQSRFEQNGILDSSMKKLQGFRNKFTRFNPVGWSIEVRSLPVICLDCMGILDYLINGSGSVLKEPLKERASKSLQNSRQLLEGLQDHYEKTA